MSIKKFWGVTPWEIIDSPRGLRFFSGGKKKIKINLSDQVLNCKTKKLHFWNFQKEMNKCLKVVNTKIFFSMKFIFRSLIKNF